MNSLLDFADSSQIIWQLNQNNWIVWFVVLFHSMFYDSDSIQYVRYQLERFDLTSNQIVKSTIRTSLVFRLYLKFKFQICLSGNCRRRFPCAFSALVNLVANWRHASIHLQRRRRRIFWLSRKFGDYFIWNSGGS